MAQNRTKSRNMLRVHTAEASSLPYFSFGVLEIME
jgi:hypothetical protein